MIIGAVVNADVHRLCSILSDLGKEYTVWPEWKKGTVTVVAGLDSLLRAHRQNPKGRFLVVETLTVARGIPLPLVGMRRLHGNLYVKDDMSTHLQKFFGCPKEYEIKAGDSVFLRIFKAMAKTAERKEDSSLRKR